METNIQNLTKPHATGVPWRFLTALFIGWLVTFGALHWMRLSLKVKRPGVPAAASLSAPAGTPSGFTKLSRTPTSLPVPQHGPPSSPAGEFTHIPEFATQPKVASVPVPAAPSTIVTKSEPALASLPTSPATQEIERATERELAKSLFQKNRSNLRTLAGD